MTETNPKQIFTIDKIRELQKDKLEEDLQEERRSKERDQEWNNKNYVERVSRAEEARKRAENGFPEVLQKINENITYSIRYKKNNITWDIRANDLTVGFLVPMIISSLQLQGYICQFDENRNLNISW